MMRNPNVAMGNLQHPGTTGPPTGGQGRVPPVTGAPPQMGAPPQGGGGLSGRAPWGGGAGQNGDGPPSWWGPEDFQRYFQMQQYRDQYAQMNNPQMGLMGAPGGGFGPPSGPGGFSPPGGPGGGFGGPMGATSTPGPQTGQQNSMLDMLDRIYAPRR